MEQLLITYEYFWKLDFIVNLIIDQMPGYFFSLMDLWNMPLDQSGEME